MIINSTIIGIIFGILVIIGKITDYFINERDAENIYHYFSNVYNILKELPIKKWEERVAMFAENFFDHMLEAVKWIVLPKNFKENLKGIVIITTILLIIFYAFGGHSLITYSFCTVFATGILGALAGIKMRTGMGFNFFLGLISGVLLEFIADLCKIIFPDISVNYYQFINRISLSYFYYNYFFIIIEFFVLTVVSMICSKVYGWKSILPGLLVLPVITFIIFCLSSLVISRNAELIYSPSFFLDIQPYILTFTFIPILIFFVNLVYQFPFTKIFCALIGIFMTVWIINQLFTPIGDVPNYEQIFHAYIIICFTICCLIVLNSLFFDSENRLLVKISSLLNVFMFSFLISITLTFITLAFSTKLDPGYNKLNNSMWFYGNSYFSLIPADIQNPVGLLGDCILILFINFPFDFLTIISTITILKHFILKKKLPIIPVALLNIVISGILAIFSYFAIDIYEFIIRGEFHFNYLYDYFKGSIRWFLNTTEFVFCAFTHCREINFFNLVDLNLYPVVLTTFFPVALYMIFLIFMSISKVFIKIIAKFFEVFIERKDRLIFTQLGVFAGLWIILFNLIINLFSGISHILS